MRTSYLSIFLAAAVFTLCVACGAAQSPGDYPETIGTYSYGRNRDNNKWIKYDPTVNKANIGDIELLNKVVIGTDVSGFPSSTDAGVGYFPTWDDDRMIGMDMYTGLVVFNASTAPYGCRHTPAIVNNTHLLFGSRKPSAAGSHLILMRLSDGVFEWEVNTEDHPASVMTAPPRYIPEQDTILVAMSSLEEAFAADPLYPCCSFRGSTAKYRASDGSRIFKKYTVDEEHSGSAVWGADMAYDLVKDTYSYTTGNFYVDDPAIRACIDALPVPRDPDLTQECIGQDNEINAIVTRSLSTGAQIAQRSVSGFDAWTVPCLFGGPHPNCPAEAGPDWDFGQAPMRWTIPGYGPVIGAGQKSGFFWTLDASTLAIVSVIPVSPPSELAGLQWGSALDDTGIYTASNNGAALNWTLVSGDVVCSGGWSKLSIDGSTILWSTPVPGGWNTTEDCAASRARYLGGFVPDFEDENFHGDFARALGTPYVVNDLMVACAMNGVCVFLDKMTGDIVHQMQFNSSIIHAPSINNGNMLIGTSYTNFGQGGAIEKAMYAYRVPGAAPVDDGPVAIPMWGILVLVGVAALVVGFIVVFCFVKPSASGPARI